MLNGYCPITLKKKSTINKKPPTRSKSAPRRSQSSLATRNLNSSSIRSQKVDEIRKEVQLEKKNKEAPINKNLKPAIRHRKDYQLWDAEGCINVETNKQTTFLLLGPFNNFLKWFNAIYNNNSNKNIINDNKK